MDSADVQRYTALFQNALVYTVSLQVLDHIISTSNITALPLVIITVLGVVTLVVQATQYLVSAKALSRFPNGVWCNSIDLGVTLLRLATDVLVQFSGQAVSRVVLYAFSNSSSDTATFTGIIIGIALLHALTRAATRPPLPATNRAAP